MGKNQGQSGPRNNFGGGKFGGGKFGGGKFGGGKFGGGKFGGGKFGGGKPGGGKPQFNKPKGADFGERVLNEKSAVSMKNELMSGDGSGDKGSLKQKQDKFRNDGLSAVHVPLSKMQNGAPKSDQQNNKNAKKRKAESDVSLQSENLEAQTKSPVFMFDNESHTDSSKKRVKFEDSGDSKGKTKGGANGNLGNVSAKGKLKFDEDASSIESSDDLEDEELDIGTGEEDTDLLDESDSLIDEDGEESDDEEEKEKPKVTDKKPIKLESSASPLKTEKLNGTPNLKKVEKSDGHKVASKERTEKTVDGGQTGKVANAAVVNAASKDKEEEKGDSGKMSSQDQNLEIIAKALLEVLKKPKVDDDAEFYGKGLSTFMRKLDDKKQGQFRLEIEQLKLKYVSEE